MSMSPAGTLATLLSCCLAPEPRRRQRRQPPPTWTPAPTQSKVRCCPGPTPAQALPPVHSSAFPLRPPDLLCLSVSPTRLGEARFRLISVSLKPTRRCSQARAE